MCTIIFAYKYFKDYPMVYIGNRDEFFKRPTERAKFHGDILMGRDLEKCGTWFGMHRNGRIGFLTNYRDMDAIMEQASTRGRLIVDYLDAGISPLAYLNNLKNNSDAYNAFNLVIGDMNNLYYFNSLKKRPVKLEPGIYGLSNGFINDPWFKVSMGRKKLMTSHLNVKDLFKILDDQTKAEAYQLPLTGLSQAFELALSSMHIELEEYGTVYKQVVIFDGHRVEYWDKTIEDQFENKQKIEFQIEG